MAVEAARAWLAAAEDAAEDDLRAVASLRPSVTAKKNRSADTVAFWLGTETPLEAKCS
jgi:hypothetical protein